MNKSDIVNIVTRHVPESELPCRIELWGSDNNKVFGSGTTWGGALERAVRFVDGLFLRDPWTRIDPADPGTLPPENTDILVSIDFKNGNGQQVVDGFLHKGLWYTKQWNPVRREYFLLSAKYFADPYAWIAWPPSAPYKEGAL